ncbi:MAG: T9SS type A sorting domain-containing protein [Bacteroidota bacterium]|nr:T9SS type A sorting domain-containing protein [Bacteroidota bacterium]
MLRIKIIIVTSLVFLLTRAGQLYGQAEPFISFNVEPGAGHTVLIQWKTVPGNDSLRFEVERSRDKKTWESIADVAARLSHQYSSIDSKPGEGLIYYRVRQVSSGNRFSYTQEKWVQISNTGKLYIWPNPAKDVLHVKTPFVNGSVDIIDPGGKLIQKISIINLVTDVSIAGLSKGVYFLHVRHKNEVLVERFMKD